MLEEGYPIIESRLIGPFNNLKKNITDMFIKIIDHNPGFRRLLYKEIKAMIKSFPL
jgi:hypothetical protein